MVQNRVPYRFNKTVGPNEKGYIEEAMPADGTIESCKIRFYLGAELDLKVLPFVQRPYKVREDIVKLIGDRNYFVGDDDVFEYELSIPVYRHEKIMVWFENVNTEYSFDLIVEIEVEHLNGANRT